MKPETANIPILLDQKHEPTRLFRSRFVPSAHIRIMLTSIIPGTLEYESRELWDLERGLLFTPCAPNFWLFGRVRTWYERVARQSPYHWANRTAY
jgi:hypothetical protein